MSVYKSQYSTMDLRAIHKLAFEWNAARCGILQYFGLEALDALEALMCINHIHLNTHTHSNVAANACDCVFASTCGSSEPFGHNQIHLTNRNVIKTTQMPLQLGYPQQGHSMTTMTTTMTRTVTMKYKSLRSRLRANAFW